MADDATTGSQSNMSLVIPPSTQEKFSELIELILRSESMNNDERQYWIDILPDMTDDQQVQLKTILTNERDQLAAIDAKYAEQNADTAQVIQTTEERIERAKERAKKEEAARQEEKEEADNVLKEME